MYITITANVMMHSNKTMVTVTKSSQVITVFSPPSTLRPQMVLLRNLTQYNLDTTLHHFPTMFVYFSRS